MNRIRVSRRILAAVLSLTVLNLCSVATIAAEIAPLSGPANALTPDRGSFASARAVAALALQPKGVSGSIGHVSWTSVAGPVAHWNCTTAEGSGVSLDLQTGRISVGERSNVNVRWQESELSVSLLQGSVNVDVPAGLRTRIETFEGTYLLQADRAHKARFSWREERLAIEGAAGVEAAPQLKMSNAALRLEALNERIALSAGAAAPIEVLVSDAAGRPLAGVPVTFSSRQLAAGGRLAFAGAAAAKVVSDDKGIARAAATFVGRDTALFAVTAAVEGAEAAAAMQASAASAPSSGGSKWPGIIAIVGAVALGVGLVLWAVDQDDPVLVPGTPTRVAP
jgi:hypothetical protein